VLVSAVIPVLVIDNDLNEFLHLLCQLDRVWRDFLERRSSTFLWLLALLFRFITLVVFNTPASSTSFLPHLVLHLVQIAVLDRLQKHAGNNTRCNQDRPKAAFSTVSKYDYF